MLFHYQIKDYYVYSESTDMRSGIDSLSGLVRNQLQKNPLNGDLFIFVNKRKTQLKLLHWQGDGYAVFYKRLEKGTYELPTLNSNLSCEINSEQLLFMLQGVALKTVQKRIRYTHFNVSK
ncbi:IS66 family insertion sequence element accessory protein TnpB [Flavobacterium sp.]|uniref:IS66 family insertion sequence element accessory protein TnpB n=1 Tax=Flavobacterium sp. TaxID=239 RepID=UPI002B4ADD8E|nr:IS66 family insertion sequence element accessory protein TnpB [Flavobacterium sp.]HLF51556.1 IS66 family insertion sequence element accessory protein TnpB [Flavobacterium sp.]